MYGKVVIGGKRFFGLDTMGLVPRVNAIKAALGLPESVVGALPIVGAAWLAMGFPTDEGADAAADGHQPSSMWA